MFRISARTAARTVTVTAVLALTSAAAFAAGHGGAVQTSGAGYLTDGHGMTLYTFDKDGEGQSNCYDTCAQKWPPLVVDPAMTLPEGFALVARTDGSQQLAYGGKPLYLWVNDTAPGQTSGDGVGGAWHIVKP